ncbi:Acetyltransferase (GNAT) family protein [Jannaschia faecimaris]|uniref:Acetyltransferase (GNAT) family protein n=1 Tax=Jannaschia faecimaris TaxID=1244108 RepID=A0A1H3J3L2_9RHOB|nr:GNAT family N-acetyltransferase [Jannaschia faecimaris]SDY34129.1 Acetyltransferase (GNAT) family protein [Jannaschia faecimaris]
MTERSHWQTIIDACWPAERIVTQGPWTLRITPGAGGRVNAMSGNAVDHIDAAEALARDNGLCPSFIIHPEQAALDRALARRGYGIEDAVTIWTIDIASLTTTPMPYATAFSIWPPLQIMRDIWAEGGHVGPERQAVMARAAKPGGILGRVDDRAAGVGFVAADGDMAMLSAVEVLTRHRRKGVAGNILRAAAHWARDHGCTRLSLVAASDNAPANATYASHGMKAAAAYHYRRAPSE